MVRKMPSFIVEQKTMKYSDDWEMNNNLILDWVQQVFQQSFAPVDNSEALKYQICIYFKGKEDNFLKRKGNTLGVKYDPESIMHYGK